MIGYLYNNNFELSGSVVLRPNPLEPNKYLTPANCTTVAPPNYNQEQIPVFNVESQDWELGKSAYWYELQKMYSEAVTTHGVPLYEQDAQGQWVERSSSEVQLEISNKQAVIDYERAVEQAKKLMDDKILEKAKEVTKGTSVESVQAFTSAYQVRVNNAIDYVGEGLIVRYALEGYVLGEALDTEVKIRDYYNKLLVYLDKFREAEINKYIQTVSSLTNPT
jgi:hypothetical protein